MNCDLICERVGRSHVNWPQLKKKSVRTSKVDITCPET